MTKYLPKLTEWRNEVFSLLVLASVGLGLVIELLDNSDFTTTEGVMAFVMALATLIGRAQAWGPVAHAEALKRAEKRS